MKVTLPWPTRLIYLVFNVAPFALILLFVGIGIGIYLASPPRDNLSNHHSSASPALPIWGDVDKVDVFLVPLPDFDFNTATQIAKSLSEELHLHIKTTGSMGDASLEPFAGTQQYSADDILEKARGAVTNFPSVKPETVFILLTCRDINMKDRSLRFVFSARGLAENLAIVSSARLTPARSGFGWAKRDAVVARVQKLTKRAIGDLYYHYRRSTDIHDLMYAPIMSLRDVDHMGEDFLAAHK